MGFVLMLMLRWDQPPICVEAAVSCRYFCYFSKKVAVIKRRAEERNASDDDEDERKGRKVNKSPKIYDRQNIHDEV